jgi:hypothetical protein
MMQYDMDEKTIQEKAVIALLRKKWPEFPKGKLIKNESPDFILKTNRKFSIGIEITRMDEPGSKHMKRSDTSGGLTDQAENETNIITITRNQLESTIQRKEEKLALYRKQMSDAYWLVITAGVNNRGFEYRVSQNIAQWQFDTVFHKIFLLLSAEEKIIEFK